MGTRDHSLLNNTGELAPRQPEGSLGSDHRVSSAAEPRVGSHSGFQLWLCTAVCNKVPGSLRAQASVIIPA